MFSFLRLPPSALRPPLPPLFVLLATVGLPIGCSQETSPTSSSKGNVAMADDKIERKTPQQSGQAKPAARGKEQQALEKRWPEKTEEEWKQVTPAEWQKMLTPQQFRITRRAATERAFSGQYWNTKTPGVYRCVCCGLPLFNSETKFDSGTGWPSYWEPVKAGAVRTKEDRGFFTVRTEVVCARCDAHLGHVFDDAPQTPTGLRYCMNSAALVLEEKGEE